MSRRFVQTLVATFLSLAAVAGVLWLERRPPAAQAPPSAPRGVAGVSVPDASAADDLPSDNPVDTRLVALTAADGATLAGALFRPEMAVPRGTAVLVLHDQPGSFASAAPTFLARGLARAGYPALALNLRGHDQHLATSRFADIVDDVRAGIDYLVAMGASQVYLVGHGLGSLPAVYYASAMNDGRVAALGLYAPIDDLPERTREVVLGAERYAALAAEAQAQVARGQGGAPLAGAPGTPGEPRAMSAATWLDWWGPTAATRATDLLPSLGLPLLVAYGTEDGLEGAGGRLGARELADAVLAAATAAILPEVVETAGSRDFVGHEQEVVARTAQWLRDVGLGGPAAQLRRGPRPVAALAPLPYATELLTVSSGGEFAGALYTPHDAARPLTVVVLPDADGAFWSSVPGFLAPGLAARGYPTLALGASRSRAVGAREVAAALDALAATRETPVVLVGHGAGGARVAAYVAQTGDPRVAALVLVGALPDSAAGAPRDHVRGLKLPLLLVHGGSDALASKADAERLLAAAEAAPRKELVALVDRVARGPTEGHAHVGLEAETIAAVADWLDARLAERPQRAP